LKTVGRKPLELFPMSTNTSFKATLARQASEKATSPASSASLTVRVLLRNANISRPVDVARVLKGLGLPLRKAHLLLDQLAESKEVPVRLDAGAIEQDGLRHLHSLGVEAHRIAPSPKAPQG
jgi:hypothetical protein